MKLRKHLSSIVVGSLVILAFMAMVVRQNAAFSQIAPHDAMPAGVAGAPMPVTTIHAKGEHADTVPETLAGLKRQATDIVVAKAIASKPGADVVYPASDISAELRLSTQYITFEVQERVKGKLGKTFVLLHHGNGIDVPVDPMYAVGETYVLFVEPNGDGSDAYMVLQPEGRYRQNKDGSLTAISKKPFAVAFNGKKTADLTRTIAQTAETK